MKDGPHLHETVAIAALISLVGMFSGTAVAGQPPHQTITFTHYNLARAFSRAGRPAAALPQFRETLRLRRDWVPALTEFSWLRATTSTPEVRNADEALALALRAVDLSRHQDGAALNALAAAYAASGRFDDACRTAEAAEKVAAVSAPSLVTQIRAHLILYRAGQAVVIPER